MESNEQVLECWRPEAFGAAGREAVARPRPAFDNDTLTTIVRFHRKERLMFLEEALFSLAIQSWHDHETVVAIQNGTDELVGAVEEMIKRQPWPDGPRYKVITVEVPPGVDGRSTLLTRGIEQASGRYLAFLDDDDIVYQHGYATLVGQLKRGGCAVAVGGCRTAKVQNVGGNWYVQTKETPFAWGRTRTDLLRDNFVPIHSYVVDRARVDPRVLYFDATLPLLEDYDFLLRLCTKYDFDFTQLDTPVCEYRIHGLNTLPYDPNAPEESRTSHAHAQKLINERKKTLVCSLPVSELVEKEERWRQLSAEVDHLRAELDHLRWRLNVLEEEKRRRFLLRVVYRVYEFFGRHPRLERRLSGLTHGAWGRWRKLRSPSA